MEFCPVSLFLSGDSFVMSLLSSSRAYHRWEARSSGLSVLWKRLLLLDLLVFPAARSPDVGVSVMCKFYTFHLYHINVSTRGVKVTELRWPERVYELSSSLGGGWWCVITRATFHVTISNETSGHFTAEHDVFNPNRVVSVPKPDQTSTPVSAGVKFQHICGLQRRTMPTVILMNVLIT